jgi:pilus assembly protein CpaC
VTSGSFGRWQTGNNCVSHALKALERNGLIKTLAEPNLTAISGETADFLAGGEFPVPIPGGFAGTSIEYRKYGVSLAYTPTVLSNGRISLRVRPEVSELSTEGAIIMDGFQVPALTVRRAETTVELGSGESFMIAGLMNNRATGAIDKIPGLGDVPILGMLFKSDSFRRGETELVIVVTPYLVKPVSAGDIKLPTDAYQVSNDLARLLTGQDSAGVTGGDRPKPRLDASSGGGDRPRGGDVSPGFNFK